MIMLRSIILMLMALTFFAAHGYAEKLSTPNCLKTHILKKVKSIGDSDAKLTLQLEIAATSDTRERGLMHRKTLAPCDGMTFWFAPRTSKFFKLFSSPDAKPIFAPQKFWMKNTLIPLDILFVDEAGKIISIVTATPLSLEPVGPDSPAATVIEIAGGRAAKEGIAVGDKVQYEIAVSPWDLAR